MTIMVSDAVRLINDSFETPEHRITGRGYVTDPVIGVLVEFDKEDLMDVGRYLYHRPRRMLATLANFDRLHYSRRVR